MNKDISDIQLSNYELKVKKKDKGCDHFVTGESIDFNEIPKGTCVIALYAYLPYYLSLREEAWFRWEKDKSSVVAFCPVAGSTVRMKIIKKRDKKILVKVDGSENCCNKMIKNKHSINTEFLKNIKIGARGLYEIIPYLFYLENSDAEHFKISLQCNKCGDKRVNFFVYKKK